MTYFWTQYEDLPAGLGYGRFGPQHWMTLAVCAPASEINETWLRLSEHILFAAYAILLVFIAAAVFLMRRVTRPLKSLAAAAKSLSEGD